MADQYEGWSRFIAERNTSTAQSTLTRDQHIWLEAYFTGLALSGNGFKAGQDADYCLNQFKQRFN